MNIINRYILGFLLSISVTLQAATLEEMLFAAIKKSDYIAVQNAINAGASVNAVDPLTGDTTIFYAVHLLIQTKLQLYVYHSGVLGNLYDSFKRFLFGATFLYFPIIFGGSIVKINQKYQFFKETPDQEFFCLFGGMTLCFVLEVLFIKNRKNQRMNWVESYRKIIQELLSHPDLNLNYRHVKTNQTIKELIKDIINAETVGHYYRYINGMRDPFPEDSAVGITVNNEEYVYPGNVHAEQIKPLLKDFLKSI